MNKFILLILLVCSLITVSGQEIQNPPIPNFHTPEESMKRIKLHDGFKLELVASEPDINEPVIIEWDANGRLYVVEMNTYMQDIDGKNQRDATSRVVRFEDTNGDGNMDKHTVFIVWESERFLASLNGFTIRDLRLLCFTRPAFRELQYSRNKINL